jgi:hypothetical protein
MNLPATEPVDGTPFAVAVWKDTNGWTRAIVTKGPQPPSKWEGPGHGWEPWRIQVGKRDSQAIAYLATRDADPPEWTNRLFVAIWRRVGRIR